MTAPTFIVGAMRSGTTLMRLILSRHTMLEIPPESHFLAKLFKRFDASSPFDDATVDEAVAIVAANTEWRRDWHGDEAELRRWLEPRPPRSLAEFIDAVFRLEIAPSGKPRWGDKTPAYLFQAERLRACFPDARFVAMVRDPRDAFLSLAPQDWVGTSTWRVGHYLQRCDGLVAQLAAGDPHFTVVRYEDLVSDPAATVRSVCAFLELDFEAAMLEFHEDAVTRVQQWELDVGTHQKLLRPMKADDVERWRREGSRRDSREIEAVCWQALRDFRYEPTIRGAMVAPLAARSRARHHLARRRKNAPAAGQA